MNYICFSPYFPPNYIKFSIALNKYGINVLGLGDAYYDNLPQSLKEALTEYYRVDDLHNYSQLAGALEHFINHHGKIDGIDSHNEYWLETEAYLRQDFGVPGLKPEQIKSVRRKSEMKKIFVQAGLNVARGILCSTYGNLLEFVKQTGFPVIAKPDSGVGAYGTFKLENEEGLKNFITCKPQCDYIIEEFIQGDIFSFDGLVDKNGNTVFVTAMKNEKGVMEVVNDDTHVYYYTLIDIPDDLFEAGTKILKAFAVRGRFFHFEFFREHQTNRLIALEVNMRPPGGFTTEMFNYSMNTDVYDAWASMVAEIPWNKHFTRKYQVCFVSRKWKYDYKFAHDELMNKFKDIIVFHQHVDEILSRAMGNYCYLLRSNDMNKIFEVQRAIHELKHS